MGSICHVYKKEFWEIINEGISKDKNKPVVEVKVGEWDDYGSCGKLSLWMTKAVYGKITANEYVIVPTPYSTQPISIKDKDNKEVNPLEDIIEISN